MARFDTSGIQDIISAMERMGQDVGPVAEEMVDAAVEEIKEAWKASAEEHGHRDTGAMIESIGFGPGPIRAGGILYRDVYPQGTDSKGTRNVEKAFILHYGCKRFPGSYWIDDADEKSAEPVQSKIEEIWDRFLASEGG